MTKFVLNSKQVEIDVPKAMPLLWALRDVLGFTGTKYGCGIGECGACTVLVDGEATRSCQLPAGAVAGAEVTTIEGLSADGSHPVQAAWVEHQVPQCGFCQPGMIMAVSALDSTKSDEDRATAITNICICGTYQRIREAMASVVDGDRDDA